MNLKPGTENYFTWDQVKHLVREGMTFEQFGQALCDELGLVHGGKLGQYGVATMGPVWVPTWALLRENGCWIVREEDARLDPDRAPMRDVTIS